MQAGALRGEVHWKDLEIIPWSYHSFFFIFFFMELSPPWLPSVSLPALKSLLKTYIKTCAALSLIPVSLSLEMLALQVIPHLLLKLSSSSSWLGEKSLNLFAGDTSNAAKQRSLILDCVPSLRCWCHRRLSRSSCRFSPHYFSCHFDFIMSDLCWVLSPLNWEKGL